MPNYSKVSTATIDDTEWGFCTPDVLDSIKARIQYRCITQDNIDADDAEQEFLLYLAVRPEQQRSMSHIIHAVDLFIRDYARTANGRAEREVSYEALYESEED